MEDESAVSALAALGQATRLAVFRLLLLHEPNGLAAGAIAELIGTPKNTMSNHLAVLAKAGLVTSKRLSQQIVYRANGALFHELISLMSQASETPAAVNSH